LEGDGEGNYVGKIDGPAKGFTAFFIELKFDIGGKYPLKLSTPVRILPDVLPHEGKQQRRAA
jgi:hypothetical protein